jgi:hypothetical protein
MTREEVAKAFQSIGESGLSATDLSDTLKSSVHAVWQIVFNEGHDVGYGKTKEAERNADGKVAAAEKRAEKAEARVKELETSQPDVAEIRKQYATEISDLKAEHEKALETERGRAVDATLRRGRSDLMAAIVALDVDPDYAGVLVERDEFRDRMSVDPETHEIVVMQKGKQIPIQSVEGKSAVKLFADEIRQGVKPKWLSSNADAGSNQQSGGTPGSSSQAGFYERVREEAIKSRETGVQSESQRKTAAERLRRGEAVT